MRVAYGAALVALCGCGRHAFDGIDASVDADIDAFVSTMPIAQYPFNEGAGQNVSSTILGSSVNGTLGPTVAVEALDPQWTTGRFGTGLVFDATDDRVVIPYPPTGFFQTLISSESITVSAWIFPMGGGGTYRVVYEIGGESNGLSLGIIDTNVLRCVLRNSGAAQRSKIVDSTITVVIGAWQYVTCSNDASGMNVYIHDDAGTLVHTVGSSGPYIWRNGSDGIAIGNNPDDNSGLRGVLTTGPESFNGIIDELRVYDQAISPAQIAHDLKTPLP